MKENLEVSQTFVRIRSVKNWSNAVLMKLEAVMQAMTINSKINFA